MPVAARDDWLSTDWPFSLATRESIPRSSGLRKIEAAAVVASSGDDVAGGCSGYSVLSISVRWPGPPRSSQD
jgi:hypothetical protein